MEWNDVTKRLPDSKKILLAYCLNGDVDCFWEGIVEVYFDSHTGWARCEKQDEKPVYVLFWSEMPELPKIDE